MAQATLPVAIDLSHHVNDYSKSRHPSPLKDIIQYMSIDQMISLAGGLPHPSLFPFERTTVQAYTPSSALDSASLVSKVTTEFCLQNDSSADNVQLSRFLQYGTGAGNPELVKWAWDFTLRVFQPAYSDFKVLLNGGSTDGWSKVVRLLCSPGDLILCEEFTYPSAQSLWIPLGCKAVPIKMDASGLRSDFLAKTLDSWATVHPGEKKPRLLYVVPVGSNPAGSTMTAERKKEIYEICVRHDIIICEDDPYTFLQYPEYNVTNHTQVFTPDTFISSLAPSFLKFDWQGRVIRLDTFSKTLAPGNRLGYFIANPCFSERLLRATEVETQDPSGWSQGIVLGLLKKWKSEGYLQWLASLREQYHTRRDWLCNAISTHFETRRASEVDVRGAEGLVGYLKGSSKPAVPIFSYVPPSGGMFVWMQFYYGQNPRFLQIQASGHEDPEQAFETEIWKQMIDSLVLLTPGSYYTPWQGEGKATTKLREAEPGIGHFRLAFSMITKEQMEQGIERLAKVLRASWEA